MTFAEFVANFLCFWQQYFLKKEEICIDKYTLYLIRQGTSRKTRRPYLRVKIFC